MSIFHNSHDLTSGFMVVTAFVLMATCSSLQAQPCYSQQDGNFDDCKIWGTERDGSGCRCDPLEAIIQPGHTVHVDSSVFPINVTVEDAAHGEPGVLDVLSSGILIVSGSIDVEDDLAVPGVFQFNEDIGAMPIVRANCDICPVTLDGPFTVSGIQGGMFDGEPRHFHMLSGFSLTTPGGPLTISTEIENDGTIEATRGPVSVKANIRDGSTGTFKTNGSIIAFTGVEVNNDGVIEADVGNISIVGPVANGGTIKASGSDVIVAFSNLTNNGTITATGGGDVIFYRGALAVDSLGLFEVVHAESQMIFISNAGTITGGADFNVEAGLMHFKRSVTTNGGYRQTGGTIKVDAGKTFAATGPYPAQ